VAAVRRDLARLERTRARGYDAIGFIQPSARKVDGHKVFALIGGQGSTIAYLDIPPPLTPSPSSPAGSASAAKPTSAKTSAPA